jgi:hypothetical protein
MFGKEWMALNKMSDADMDSAQTKGVWKLYIIQFIVTLVTFCVLGFFIKTLGLSNASDGAFFAALAWLGFTATTAVGSLIWEKRPFKLILIGSISNLICLVVGGAIIGAWR